MKSCLIVTLLLASSLSFAGNSKENREGLKYQSSLGWGGAYMDSGSIQLNVSKFLTSEKLLGIKISGTNGSNENQLAAAIQYKHFFSNSFYIAPEAYYLNWFEHHNQSSAENLTTLGIAVRIGNQWQWERFTIGVDWIGYGRHLAYFRKDAKYRDFADGLLVYSG